KARAWAVTAKVGEGRRLFTGFPVPAGQTGKHFDMTIHIPSRGDRFGMARQLRPSFVDRRRDRDTEPSPRPRHLTQMPHDAPIVQAIAYGVRAPNPHNTQAWRFELASDTEALFYLDERRLLPAADPAARQIHIGAGCAIETLAIGMSGQGYAADVELLP